MRVWALRDKNTKLYIPDSRYYKSHEEPSSKDSPRLFLSKRGAQNCLTAWLAGKWAESQEQDSSYFGETEYYSETVVKELTPWRKRENMEIVEFDLIEVLPCTKPN